MRLLKEDKVSDLFANEDFSIVRKGSEIYLTECHSDSKDIEIPDGVTVIDEHAFDQFQTLHTIKIPSTVYAIGQMAFANCSNLSSVDWVPASSATVGWGAFAKCTKLAVAPFIKWVSIFGDNAFNESGLTSVEFGDSVKRIGEAAFGSCAELKSVVMPKSFVNSEQSLSNIGQHIFSYCGALTTVTFPEECNLSHITRHMFFHCVNLCDIQIPKSVRRIEESAFAACRALSNLNLSGDRLIIIGDAFEGCINLSMVEINNKSLTINDSAFAWCKALKYILFNGDDLYISLDCNPYGSFSTEVPDECKGIYIIAPNLKDYDNVGNHKNVFRIERSIYNTTMLDTDED